MSTKSDLADNIISQAVKYDSRLDWNGESFDINECYQMPDSVCNKILKSLEKADKETIKKIKKYFKQS